MAQALAHVCLFHALSIVCVVWRRMLQSTRCLSATYLDRFVLHLILPTNPIAQLLASIVTSYEFSVTSDNGTSKMLRKVGGLVFTYEQLAQLARHSHPDNEKNGGRMGVFVAIAGTAYELGSQFIYVDYPVKDKPGETIPGFVYLLYARLSDEPKTKFKSFRAGPHVAEFRKVFAERGVEGHLPFCTILGV
ncbi:hypothetical protein BU15DRAFT_66274 [Melanogaster broomeanus]|nr:hypothetical protein BU15DRAFT_66274 [Melanogaster broomeanus]